MKRNDPLRNLAIVAALEQALSRGTYRDLYFHLVPAGGLPGPRPNWALGWAFARTVAGEGKRGDALVAELVAMNEHRAAPRSAEEFLPLAGALCLSARAATGPGWKGELERLAAMADDSRHLVREAVAVALVDLAVARSDELIAALADWMTAYLPAAVALAAMTSRGWLDRMTSSDQLLARLDEAFSLAENAPRADRRSQGYRALVAGLGEAPANVIDRFAAPALVWLETRVATDDVALREALQALIGRARSRGHGADALQGAQGGLDASAPPRRDPRTYVGPTRQRGKK